MKTIVAAGLMALFLIAVVVGWTAHGPSAAPASASQIYIHGTPVCVFRHGDSIVASVGECGTGAGLRDEAPEGRNPDDGVQGMDLPPGHPPVSPDMVPDGGERRILI